MLESGQNDAPATPCWVLTDGAAGNERQALALAQALGLATRSMVLPLQAPWSWLAPRGAVAGRLTVNAIHRERLAPPWPALVIGCGRSAALLTRVVARLSGGTCRSVQILDPRIDARHWDLVIAPHHDDLAGEHVVNTLGSLHPVDDDWLQAGREAFPALGQLPGPRVGVLLGGPRRGVPLDAGQAAALADALRKRHRAEGASVMLVASRRTPPALYEAVHTAIRDIPGLRWRDSGDGPNPYPGVLGWADRLVVTPDSVNMLSEAAATGVPVHTLDSAALPPRLSRFHAALRERGLLHALDANAQAPSAPLRETVAVAVEVRRRLHLPVAHPGVAS